MRIHGNTLTTADVRKAAEVARVTLDRFTEHGSRARVRAFDITLQGESRRHQNGGSGKAATWDQWGVFIAALFDADDTVTIPRAYVDRYQFDARTNWRFEDGWPEDAHGDHRFEYAGIPMTQGCNKCSATYSWSL